MAGNTVRITVTAKDEVSGPLDKIRDKAAVLSKTDFGKGIAQGMGIGFTSVIRDATDAVVAFGVGSVKAASDSREAMALNAQVFERNADAIEQWAKSADDAFSSTEAVNFAAQFGTAFKNVGMSLDETSDKAKAMTTLAGDLGSAFNASSEEAATALRSGLLGESEPMRRFGVFLDEAKVKAKAAAMGMETLGGRLTDGQKVAARYAIIMEQTADSQGMFGRDTGSAADAGKRLESNLDDLQTLIGEELVPVLASATDALDEFVKHADDIKDAPGNWWDDATKGIQDFIDTLPKHEKTFSDSQKGMALVAFRAGERIQGSIKKTKADAGSGADDIVEDNRKIKRSYEDLEKYLTGQYSDNFDTALDVVDARSELSAAKTERANLEKQLSSGKLTGEQARDAKKRMHDLDVETAHNHQVVADAGALSAEGYDAWKTTVERLAKGTKGKVHDLYLAAIKDIQALKAAASGNIGVSVTYRAPRGRNQPRAAGGYIEPYSSALVNEGVNGTEAIFSTGSAGAYVNPSASAASAAIPPTPPAPAQPTIININVEGLVRAETPEDIGRILRRVATLGMGARA
jgi:hypothetical protein